jgi:chromosome segregation ATPase
MILEIDLGDEPPKKKKLKAAPAENKKPIEQEMREVAALIEDLSDRLDQMEKRLRPKLSAIYAAEDEIRATVEGRKLRLSDRDRRRHHYQRILDIRAEYGREFEEMKAVRRQLKNAVNVRNILSKQVK